MPVRPTAARIVGELMEDPVAFANDDALEPVTQAAVLHAQFESIRPYGDGNGRIGRILIGWCSVTVSISRFRRP